MARILGVEIPNNKRGEIALSYLFGIGRKAASFVLAEAQVDSNKKAGAWTDEESGRIRKIITANYKIEGELRSEIQLNRKRLMDIGSYRGIRQRMGLPSRGQKTKNNARTLKGKRKTIANKKKATKK